MASIERSIGAVIAEELVHGRNLLKRAETCADSTSWEEVLAFAEFWSLRDDKSGRYSVRNMSDEELGMSFVEDLLFVTVEIARGAAGYYPREQAIRHLETSSRSQYRRIEKAIDKLLASGLAIDMGSNRLALEPSRLVEAQNYCGVEILDWTGTEPDLVKDLTAVGGVELLADAIDDVIAEVDDAEFSSNSGNQTQKFRP